MNMNNYHLIIKLKSLAITNMLKVLPIYHLVIVWPYLQPKVAQESKTIQL